MTEDIEFHKQCIELIALLQETQKDLEDANAIKAVIMEERTQWESAARSIVNALGESVVGLQSPNSVRDTGVAAVVALLKKKGDNNV